ncbi:MAG: carbon-nitrogen family hydrolase [Lachnospiraceae bacterium]|nr:carbon-nitrogen family hydrolase [Lachnospiraceae bacterium]
MKIGMAQIRIPWKKYEENKEICRSYFEKAQKNQIDLLVFPEMTLTGFDVKSPELAQREQDTIDFFENMTKKYEIAAVYGFAGKGKEKNRNHLRISSQGKCIMEYEKIHPFSYGAEGKYFEGGEAINSCRFQGEDFSGLICYDLRFPEVFQIASRKSNCIFVIANWPKARIFQWNALLRARAIENLCYIVGVNCTGESGPLFYNGMSGAYGPDGRIIAGEQEEEDLIVAELDFDWLRQYQSQFPFKKDRRTKLYNYFYENEDQRES